MQDFAHVIGAWQPFFITLAGVCATLAGLLFVALSLHAGALRDAGNANLRRLAQLTFGDLVQILFVGMFYSVPLAPASFYGMATLLIVALGIPDLGGKLLEALRDRQHSQHRLYIFRRLGAAVLGRTLLVVGAVGLLRQHDDAQLIWQDLLFVFSGSVALLIAAMRNAWFLLMRELA